jgi:alkylation response protein AidB-like acyl-CoA dehydrogenase
MSTASQKLPGYRSPASGQRLEDEALDKELARLTKEFAQGAADLDRSGAFPAANFQRLHGLGLLALTVPRAQGGWGAELGEARKVIAAVARGEPATALILSMQYLQHSRLQQDKRWPESLRHRVTGDAVENGALLNALRVEPDLGTPARGGLPATIARRTGEGWVLNGSKIYSTGSHGLSWFLVWARSDDADPLVGGWLVHKNSPGVEIIEDWDHLGMRATCSHEVRFRDVRVPLDHAVSVTPWSTSKPEFDPVALRWITVLLPAIYDSIARAARDWLVTWLHQRQPSNLGASLATLPRFQEVVGKIDTLLFTSQTLLDATEAGNVATANLGQVKHVVTQNAIEAVGLAVEAAGNHGLTRNHPLERHYRNVLCGRVHTPQDDVIILAAGRAGLSAVAELK